MTRHHIILQLSLRSLALGMLPTEALQCPDSILILQRQRLHGRKCSTPLSSNHFLMVGGRPLLGYLNTRARKPPLPREIEPPNSDTLLKISSSYPIANVVTHFPQASEDN